MKKVSFFPSALILAAFNGSVLATENPISLNYSPSSLSQSDLGGVGLLQVPTARMLQEGDFTLGYKDNDNYRFWTASLQLFPWFEATIRYADFRDILYSSDVEFSGNQTAKDKGIDAKIRLIEESKYVPQLAVGFRDFGGTGFFESEYLMASKRVGDLDVHLGIGWGYLGNAGNITNPFCEISDRFCSRGSFGGAGVDQGGQLEVGDFFSGNASIIGGIEYQSPWDPLRFKLEYEGNDYRDERGFVFEQDSRWNFGVNYRYKGFDFSLSWERGNTFGFGANYTFNFHEADQYKFKPKKQSLENRERNLALADIDKDQIVLNISRSGMAVRDLQIEEDKVVVFGTRNQFRDQDEAIERISRGIAVEVPDQIKSYHIVEAHGSFPLVETVVDAEEFIKVANRETLKTDITATFERQDPSQDILDKGAEQTIRGFYGNASTFWTQSFGAPEAFYLFQLGANLAGGYIFDENFSVNTSVRVNLLDNFDNFNFTVDSLSTGVPRVRTLVREYIQKGDVSVDTLFAHWNQRIAPNLYAQAYAGHLELMYGGIGGELYYQEVDSNIGFGLDLNYVRQRSFENDYEFLDYKTFTGHFSVYWQPKFVEDVQLTFNIGQFLARDKGVNFDFAKRFDSGIVVGAYAAITDMSAEEYGEGSFTKGFYISIPFDIFSLRPSTARGRIPWVPIGRDGGQPLSRPIRLVDMTMTRSPFVR